LIGLRQILGVNLYLLIGEGWLFVIFW
jgi:hypothetical protein